MIEVFAAPRLKLYALLKADGKNYLCSVSWSLNVCDCTLWRWDSKLVALPCPQLLHKLELRFENTRSIVGRSAGQVLGGDCAGNRPTITTYTRHWSRKIREPLPPNVSTPKMSIPAPKEKFRQIMATLTPLEVKSWPFENEFWEWQVSVQVGSSRRQQRGSQALQTREWKQLRIIRVI